MANTNTPKAAAKSATASTAKVATKSTGDAAMSAIVANGSNDTGSKVIKTPTAATPTKKADIATDIFNNILTINFSNGEVIEVDITKLSPEIQKQAMLHGLKQKLVDAAAIARDTSTGRSATIADKFVAVKEVADRITSADGTWNKVREAGATSSGSASLLARALVQLTGKPRADIDAFLETKSKEEKKALATSDKVAPIIAQLQNAAVASIDADGMLQSLM